MAYSNQDMCPNCRDKSAQVVQVIQQFEYLKMEQEDVQSAHRCEKQNLVDRITELQQQLNRARAEATDLRTMRASLNGCEKRNRELEHENIQLRQQQAQQGSYDEKLLQHQMKQYQNDFLVEREAKEKALATNRQLRQEIEGMRGRGGGGDPVTLQLQMDVFRRDFDSERLDKQRAQATVLELRKEVEQLKESKLKLLTERDALEKECVNLRTINEILQADAGGVQVPNAPVLPAVAPNLFPAAAPNLVPNAVVNPAAL